MNPSIGKKLSFFIGTVVILTAGGMGYVSYRMMETRFVEVLHKDTLDASTLLASRVRNELRHVAEKARILSAAALEEFKNPEDQMRFLEDNLTMDDQFLAMTLFRRSEASKGVWKPVFRLTRQEHDPEHLSDEDFKQLDLKYPLDNARVASGAVEVTVGALKDGTPILRLGVPIVRKKHGGAFTQLLGVEVRQERITAAFADSTAHFSFILDRFGRVISQTDPTHFTLGEDLSHLPILMMAQATEAPNGNLDYYEVPGAPLQYGSFHKVGFADLTVVTQAPQTQVTLVLRDYTRQAGFMALACAFVTLILGLLVCWGVVGLRLQRIARTLLKLGSGDYHVQFSDVSGEDEIGDFARTLQGVADHLDEREKHHGTYAKMRIRRTKAWLSAKPNMTGDRAQAYVLDCHLRDLDKMTGVADPASALTVINEFNQKACSIIEAQGGVVDHVHGGSIVAFWGIPVAAADDSDRVLYTALQIRTLARELNETLKRRHFHGVRLSMGLSCGNVIAGEVGTDDRREFTLIGEAVEVAARIQGFTEQFGTDFLLTGNAARTAPEWYSLEQVSAGDQDSPELYECVATARRGALATVDEQESEANAVSTVEENHDLITATAPAEIAAETPVESEPELSVAEVTAPAEGFSSPPSEITAGEPAPDPTVEVAPVAEPTDIRTRKRKRKTSKDFAATAPSSPEASDSGDSSGNDDRNEAA